MESSKVLFITTKNLDYIRNSQEIRMLKEQYECVDIVGSNSTNYVGRLLKVYSRLLCKKLKGYDEVFVGFAPQLIIPLFKWKFKHMRIVMDFFISFYDTLVFDRKNIKAGTFFAKLLKRIDKYTINSADEVIVDTKTHGGYFCEEFGYDINQIKVMYLEADKDIYYPRIVDRPKELLDKKIVLYFGSILPLQGIGVILETIELLKDRNDIHFIVIGPVKDKGDSNKNENVTYIEWLPQEKLADYIAMSDICLAGHFNADIQKASRTIPGKAYIYNAMEKPMILGDNSATRELFDESMPGIYFTKMGLASELSKTILKHCKIREENANDSSRNSFV